MIPKKPAPHVMRGGYRFLEKIVLSSLASPVLAGICVLFRKNMGVATRRARTVS
jgi:hypothetical protein